MYLFDSDHELQREQQRQDSADLLVDQTHVRPNILAVVQVAQRVSGQISSGQNDGVCWDGGQKLPAEPLNHAVSALIALPGIIGTYTISPYVVETPSYACLYLKRL